MPAGADGARAQRPTQPSGGVDVVNAHTLVPLTFWSRYVAARKPVLIRGHPGDLDWRAHTWDIDHLRRNAAEAQVMVEVRRNGGDSFGKGVRRRMAFADFLAAVAAGDTSLYLSAQQVGVSDDDGHPELMAPPLRQLQRDFGVRPSLAGNLVPQQINLWMGNAPAGSSSGLHHDFHDNLYILLQGTKRFRLYPPSAAHRMATTGKIARVHPNGRIVYEGQGDVRADGSDAADVARWEAKRKAEQQVEEAQHAVGCGEEGAEARLAAAEAALEDLLEQELSDAIEDGGFDSDDDGDDDDDEEQEEGSKAQRGKGARGARPTGGKGGAGELEVDPDTPPSFSQVDLSLPDDVLAQRFPRFPGRAAALECTVEKGMMLFLPAGWFHEVTSFSGRPGDVASSNNSNNSSHNASGFHLAFNYWFYPPDNLDPSLDGFRRPYTSEYLPSLWRSRLPEGHPARAVAGAEGEEAEAGGGGAAGAEPSSQDDGGSDGGADETGAADAVQFHNGAQPDPPGAQPLGQQQQQPQGPQPAGGAPGLGLAPTPPAGGVVALVEQEAQQQQQQELHVGQQHRQQQRHAGGGEEQEAVRTPQQGFEQQPWLGRGPEQRPPPETGPRQPASARRKQQLVAAAAAAAGAGPVAPTAASAGTHPAAAGAGEGALQPCSSKKRAREEARQQQQSEEEAQAQGRRLDRHPAPGSRGHSEEQEDGSAADNDAQQGPAAAAAAPGGKAGNKGRKAQQRQEEEDGDLDPPRRGALPLHKQQLLDMFMSYARTKQLPALPPPSSSPAEAGPASPDGARASGGAKRRRDGNGVAGADAVDADAERGGGAEGGAAGEGGRNVADAFGEQGLSDADYRLLMMLQAAQQRRQAMAAMRQFYERMQKQARHRRIMKRVPRGRRHHPVVPLDIDVRRYRPAKAMKDAEGDAGRRSGTLQEEGKPAPQAQSDGPFPGSAGGKSRRANGHSGRADGAGRRARELKAAAVEQNGVTKPAREAQGVGAPAAGRQRSR